MHVMFKPMKQRLRASFSAGTSTAPRFENIDRENEVLHGVQITLEGEAKGHGIWLERAFCEAVAEAGNAAGDAGVKVRFGHPAMCSDALGTYLGRAKNFRVVDLTRKEGDGETVAGVLADIHIAPESHSSPKGDLGKWILEAAENSPDTFGQSIVFTYADLKVKDADGNDHSYQKEVLEPSRDENGEVNWEQFEKLDKEWREKSADGRVYAVLGKLLGTDFTDTPAATDGVFSANDLAAEAEEMLEEHPEIAATLSAHPEKALEFLDRMGMLDKLTNARLAGLQAAKDKEIAALEAQLAEKTGEIDTLKADIGEKTKALDAANAALEQLKSTNAESEKALSETKAALEEQIQRYREQVGAAMTQPEANTTKELHGAALIRSRFVESAE